MRHCATVKNLCLLMTIQINTIYPFHACKQKDPTLLGLFPDGRVTKGVATDCSLSLTTAPV